MQHTVMHGGLKGCQCPTSNSLSWMLPPFSIPWDTASLGTHPVLAGGSNGAGDCHLPLPSIQGAFPASPALWPPQWGPSAGRCMARGPWEPVPGSGLWLGGLRWCLVEHHLVSNQQPPNAGSRQRSCCCGGGCLQRAEALARPCQVPSAFPPGHRVLGLHCGRAKPSSTPRLLPSLCLPGGCCCPPRPLSRAACPRGEPSAAWLLPAEIFPSPLLDRVGPAVPGQGGLPGHAIPSLGAWWVQCPALLGSHHIPPAHPDNSLPWGQGWAVPLGGPSAGAKPQAPASHPRFLQPPVPQTLHRVGAVRSHLPLIEFICYNPKQCKAGFSQAPAACLPIKIPSQTANPPSRLDIKQPVSKKRRAKFPCT